MTFIPIPEQVSELLQQLYQPGRRMGAPGLNQNTFGRPGLLERRRNYAGRGDSVAGVATMTILTIYTKRVALLNLYRDMYIYILNGVSLYTLYTHCWSWAWPGH